MPAKRRSIWETGRTYDPATGTIYANDSQTNRRQSECQQIAELFSVPPQTLDACCTSGVKQVAASDAEVSGDTPILSGDTPIVRAFEPVRRSGVRKGSPLGSLEVHTANAGRINIRNSSARI